MSFNTALSAGQKTKIRSASYYSELQLTLCSNTVKFAGQVNSDLTTPTSWRQFNYNNVSVGAYTDVEPNEVLLIGTANDITKATFRGRIHSVNAPSATVIYCSESSADFVAGAYFWVIYSFDPTYLQARPSTDNPATASELVDGDLTYAPPRASCVGLRTAYVNRVDPSSGKMRVAFDVSNSFAVASGDSISSYLFTFVASTYTVISGSLSTATVTVDFNADTEQWGKLVITTANGQIKTRRFYVRAYGTTSQPDTGADETSIQISGDLSRGWTLSASYFTGVDSVLNRTFAVAWRENENYGGVAGGLDSNNIAFVGWLQREDDDLQADAAFSVLSSARFEFTGVGPRMQKLRAQEVAIRINSSPAEWGDIVNLTPWRAIAHFLDRYSTITSLCDLDFSDKTNAYLFPDFGTQGGNLYSAVQGIAQQIAANLEFAPDGRIEVNISAEYLTNLGRAGLVTVLDLQAQDCHNIQRSLDPDPTVGVVDGIGASYNSTSGQVSVYAALAPGHAQGEAAGGDTLQGPVLVATPYASAALIDLTTRAGNRFEVANNNEVLEIDHPDGFTFPIPSRFQLYTLTIDTTVAGPNGVSRIIYDTTTQWLLEAVSFSRPGNGATNVHCRYRKLSRIGDPGDNVTQVAANQLEDTLPDLGDFAFNWDLPELYFPDAGLAQVNPAQLAPPKGMIAPTNGQYLLAASTTNVFLLKNVITLTRPQAVDITPSDLGNYTVRSVLLDPFFTKTEIGGYILASDGTNSAIWFNPNIAAPNASEAWTKGADIVGVYTVLRAGNAAGLVLIYTPVGTSDWIQTFDFISSDGGFYLFPTGAGVYTASTGWEAQPQNFGGADRVWVQIAVDISVATTVTHVDFQYDCVTGSEATGSIDGAAIYKNTSGTVLLSAIDNASLVDGNNQTFAWNGSAINPAQIIIEVQPTYAALSPGSATITRCTISGTGSNPFGGGSNHAHAALSGDYGLTLGVIDVGPNLASGGFDVQRAGSVSYAAVAGAVYRATTLGGAYASWYSVPGAADPVCIIIPYFRRNVTTRNTSVSNPDVIIGCSDGKWYWLDGAAATATDITPVASLICGHPDALTVRYGNMLAAWGTVAGQQKVYTSVNGGTSWTFRANISGAGKIRCRRNDDRLSPNGQVYLAQANVIDYSRYWLSNTTADWPRTMPVSGITMFDVLW